MTPPDGPNPESLPPPGSGPARVPARGLALALALFRLARPRQWAKSAFVLIGPLYGLSQAGRDWRSVLPDALAAAAAFALASSAAYIINDIRDRDQDRLHPRKRRRPIASGEVTPSTALLFALALLGLSFAIVALTLGPASMWTTVAIAAYFANVLAYSTFLKKVVIADVICLSVGFVIRVLGGCAATMIEPSTWLLNVTFFLAMFLSFGKRLGERRSMQAIGGHAADVRAVQGVYTDDLLRMAVVVTAVATLVTYSAYVQAQEFSYKHGFNLLWLTLIPATYGLMRCIVLVEQGTYDDPTEIATRDRRIQGAALVFALLVGALMIYFRQ